MNSRSDEAYPPVWEGLLRRVRGITRAKLGGSPNEIDDSVSDTMLKIVSGLNRGLYENRGEGSFGSWTLTVALNQIRNDIRDGTTKRQRVVSPSDDFEELFPDSGPLPEAMVIRRETVGRMKQVINGLSSKEQRLIALKYNDGLMDQEIADRLGTTEGAIKSRLVRLKTKLKEVVKPSDF